MGEHIPTIIISILLALFGAVLPYAIKALVFAFRRSKNTLICDEWYAYIWWTKNGKISFDKMSVEIKKAVLSEYKVKATHDIPPNTLIYSGKAYIEDNNLCLEMSVSNITDHMKDSTRHRYHLPAIEERERLYGFWLSYDAELKVSAGGAVLSRTELTSREKKKVIADKFKIHGESPVMALK